MRVKFRSRHFGEARAEIAIVRSRQGFGAVQTPISGSSW